MDKVNRCGIRVEDLLCEDALREKLSFNLEIKNMHLTRIYGEAPMAFGEIFDQARVWGEKLGPYVGDASLTIFEALVNGNNVLFEGAQGTLLDLDHGTYPFVTSSSPVAGGACGGAGLGPSLVGRVTGVVKAYCTRVGEGPFPTEHRGKSGDVLRERGGEFGATTGRPRRCGWLDLVALKYAVRVNGIHALALTKLDVLSGFETIPVCVSYRSDEGENLPFKGNLTFLDSVEPVFRNMDGWKRDLGECRSFDDLPRAARDYIRFIEEETGVPVCVGRSWPQQGPDHSEGPLIILQRMAEKERTASRDRTGAVLLFGFQGTERREKPTPHRKTPFLTFQERKQKYQRKKPAL
jgi:adenylosuccinate synthase